MSYSVNELLSLTMLSFQIEFYYDKDIEILYEKINKIIYQSRLKNNDVKLKKIYKNSNKFCLCLPFLDTFSALALLKEFFNFAEKECEAKFDTNMNVEIKFVDSINIKSSISNLDIQRFILGFNENIIWQNFPDRENNQYCLSLKTNNIFNAIGYNSPNILLFNKYSNYGVSFEKILQNILILNYIGGASYIYNFHKIKEILEYVICFTYYCLDKPISNKEKNIFNNFKLKLSDFNKYFLNINSFKEKFKNFKLLVDLKSDEQIIKLHWSDINKNLFEIFFNNPNIDTGIFNLDTTIHEYQLKNIKKINNCILNNFAILDSNIESCILNNATLFNNDIKGCVINNSIFNYGNKIEKSQINNSIIKTNNNFFESIIINAEKMEGELSDCILKDSIVNYKAELQNTTIIKKKDNLI